MTVVECFWVEETGDAEVTLRRYLSGTGCAPMGHCNELVPIGRKPLRRTDDGYIASIPPLEYLDDPRWPAACSVCGRAFGPLTEVDGVGVVHEVAHTQVNQEPIYRAADGREWRMDRLPAGAMFDAVWRHPDEVGSDDVSLTIVTPYQGEDARSGFWSVDGPATGGPGGKLVPHAWTRTGDPRIAGSVTATPSILTGTYHGWLRNGTLVPA